MQAVASELPPGGLLTISGSIPLGAPDDGYRDLVAEARAAGVRVALDAEGAPLRNAIGAGPDVVKVNAAEAAGLLGFPVATRDEAMAAAERLRRGDATSVAAGLLRLHADRVRMVQRERSLRDRFATAHPQVETVVVPALAGDVHDLGGLRRVGTLLADGS